MSSPKACSLDNLLRPLHWTELILIGAVLLLHITGFIRL
jgi:hypothetical protein